MRARHQSVRAAVSDALRKSTGDGRYDFSARQDRGSGTLGRHCVSVYEDPRFFYPPWHFGTYPDGSFPEVWAREESAYLAFRYVTATVGVGWL